MTDAAPPDADADADVGAGEDIDARIRRLDPDRWLASRFISDPRRRAEVVAIYALNDELARVGETVTQPLIGEIRLAWWRDRIEDLFDGRPIPAQPALEILAEPIAQGRLPQALFEALVEARHQDLDPMPFGDDAALARYLDGTAGAVMGLAACALCPAAPLAAVIQAGRAWGMAGLYRARAHWAARNRRWTPPSWDAPRDEAEGEAALAARVRAEVASALTAARQDLKALPVSAFPAVAYTTLSSAYACGHAPGQLETRLRLLWTTATGRL
jgi:phytoene synthase